MRSTIFTPSSANRAMIARLRTIMEKRGINARQLAERARVGKSFVYDILSGKSANPTSHKLAAVAEVLHVSVQYLLHGVNTPLPRAGFPPENDSDKDIFSSGWIRDYFQVNPTSMQSWLVTDDSMEPYLMKGDTVLVNLKDRRIQKSGIFMVEEEGRLHLMRVEISSSRHGMLRLTRDNVLEPPRYVQASEAHILGRVVWFSRALVPA